LISVDTQIWLAFANREPVAQRLVALLREGIAEVHPLVLAELDFGVSARARATTLRALDALVGPPARRHEEVVAFARENGVVGAGVGYVDAHLLASAYLDGRMLWAGDDEVQQIADRLGIGFRANR